MIYTELDSDPSVVFGETEADHNRRVERESNFFYGLAVGIPLGFASCALLFAIALAVLHG